MAERRMFAKTIVTSDAFLDMSPTARCLYFTLAMFADDDGFVNNPKSIMRQTGATVDDMNLLITKKFVLAFDSGVIVIKHWRIHNYIQSDRYHATKYQDEKSLLDVDENKAYTMSVVKLDTPCIQDVSKADTEVRLGKSKSKDRLVKHIRNQIPPTREMVSEYIAENHYRVDADAFMDYYESKGWLVGKTKMKDWQATVRNWNRKESGRSGCSNADSQSDAERYYTTDFGGSQDL